MALTGFQRQLDRLKQSTAPVKKPPETDEEWLVAFREHKAEGFFRNEPDYEIAIQEYEAAIAVYPTARRTQIAFSQELSIGQIFFADRRLKVAKGWLMRMVRREQHGYEGITEVEYEKLKAWFYQHHQELGPDPVVYLDRMPERSGKPESLSESIRLTARENPYAVNTVRVLRQIKADWEARISVQEASNPGEKHEARLP